MDGSDWRGVRADIGRTRTAHGRARLGSFSIEGTRLHERALRARAALESTLVGESFAASSDARVRRLISALHDAGCKVRVVPDRIIAELTEGREIGAMVGLVRMETPRTIEELLQESGSDPRRILAAVDVEDPGNVGAMVRTALAAGATAFVAAGISDPYHPRAVRTSMGAVFRLPVVRYVSARTMVDSLGELGVTRIGAVSRGGTPPGRLEISQPARAILIGSEAFGLPEEIVSELEHRVSIPMSSQVDSYSANAAAAILLYALAT